MTKPQAKPITDMDFPHKAFRQEVIEWCQEFVDAMAVKYRVSETVTLTELRIIISDLMDTAPTSGKSPSPKAESDAKH